jgi:hypothetical protein
MHVLAQNLSVRLLYNFLAVLKIVCKKTLATILELKNLLYLMFFYPMNVKCLQRFFANESAKGDQMRGDFGLTRQLNCGPR